MNSEQVRKTQSFSLAGSGYGWLSQLPATLRPLASWGRDGWDLGDWPCVAYAWGILGDNTVVERYVEGDVTRWVGPNDALIELLNDEAAYWWNQLGNGPDEITPDILGPYPGGVRPFRRLAQPVETT